MPKKDKKQDILNAALKVFARYGFKKATVADVAKEVSMTKSNLYFYVPGKRELYDQSIRNALQTWRDSVAAAIAEKDNAIEKFMVMAVKSYEYLANDEQLRAILIRDPGIFTLSPAEDRFYEINQGAMRLIRDILLEGIREGHFIEVDVDQTTEFLFSVYIMFLIKTYIKSEGVSAFGMYKQGTSLVLRGLCRAGP